MDGLAALRLQIEWGADEALQDLPIDRFMPAPTHAPTPAAPAASARRPASPTLAALADAPALAAQAAAAATDLAALHAALDGFDACPLRATASRTVAPSGNPHAGLVLLAEAPGPEDDRSGQAFSGEAGAQMDRILRSAGLSRDNLLLALLTPWRPPGGRPANEAELALCLPFLHRLLVLTRPRRLVLMGAGPIRALTDAENGRRRPRGKWTQVVIPGLDAPIPALAMLPPDQWLNSPANKQGTWSDLLSLHDDDASNSRN
jgi:uracil-DNA glycosylase family 4